MQLIMEEKKVYHPFFTNYIDLAQERLGGKALISSDDFFAEKENLLKPGRGIFIPDKYTDRGKWMDGWESRRKRVPGYDWCIIKLATSGIIKGLDIDTNHFLGNHPPFASVDACCWDNNPSTEFLQSESANWIEILPKNPLAPGNQNFFEINNLNRWTHVRLNIYPDGGVARFKVYGEVVKNWTKIKSDALIDLAAAINGGKALACNDMFFSSKDNLIMPGRGINMGDGWETKRNRTPNNRDWLILRLAHPGFIKKILVDTCHFKGNYPDRCSIEGTAHPLTPSQREGEETKQLSGASIKWVSILPQAKLQADHEHYFENEIENYGPFTHVRLNIFPDGGVSRLRLFGTIDAK
jgi:allantoicase